VTLEELRQELGRGELRPAYLVAGEEPLLRDEAVAAIREAVLGDGPADFNLDRLEGSSVTPDLLLAALRTLPALAARRLVLLREPEAGRAIARGLGEALEQALAELDAEATSVMVVVAARVDGRARWVKAFPSGARVSCDPPRRARELVAFAHAEAERQGVRLDRGAAELLAERVGPQLLMLRQEIAKAVLRAGPRARKVTRAHVAEGAADVAEEPIWDLTDAIGEGRGPDALGVLARLLRAGAAPPALLGSLASHFRRLLRVSAGGSVAGPPFVRRKLEAQAGRFNRRRLLVCLDAIHQTDLALKGQGGLRPELALERLVLGLAA
jgi:DNA polymerase-3 subunit delta